MSIFFFEKIMMKRRKITLDNDNRPSCSRTEDEIDDEKFEENHRRIQKSIQEKLKNETNQIGKRILVAKKLVQIKLICLFVIRYQIDW